MMPEPDFVASYARGPLVLVLLACSTLLIGGLWMAGIVGEVPSTERYPKAIVVAVGWLNVLLSALGGAEIAKRLIKAGEHLRIGAAGIRCNAWSDQTIPWSEIEEVTTWRVKQQRAIVLRLRDPSRYPSKRLLDSLPGSRLMSGGDILIYLLGTDRTFDHALEAVRHFRSAAA